MSRAILYISTLAMYNRELFIVAIGFVQLNFLYGSLEFFQFVGKIVKAIGIDNKLR